MSINWRFFGLHDDKKSESKKKQIGDDAQAEENWGRNVLSSWPSTFLDFYLCFVFIVSINSVLHALTLVHADCVNRGTRVFTHCARLRQLV